MESLVQLRLPRGLLDDLETTILHQDRAFLTEVARSLKLPVQDVLRTCLGTTGTPTSMVSLWTSPHDDSESAGACPYYTRLGDGLWVPCARTRIAPTLPCVVHERNSQNALLGTDFALRKMGEARPVHWQGKLYWWVKSPQKEIRTNGTINPSVFVVYREDGTIERSLRFFTTTFRGKEIIAATTVKKK